MTRTLQFIGISVAILITAFAFAMYQGNRALGSVESTHEYTATSTAASSIYGAFTTGRVIKTGTGTFGSLVITGAATGILNFYDATTTNVNLRTGNKATSTILLTSIPASAAAGDYVFDVSFSDGLLLDVAGGNMPTSTITFR